MIINTLEVVYYWTVAGKCPYKEWFNLLPDITVKQIIDARITRVERGLLGECNWIGGGVWELKFRIGAGVRIYFGKQGRKFIILLCGGDKGSQNKDIKRACDYWKDYLRRLPK